MEDLQCQVCHQLQERPSILPCCHKSVCNSHISEHCPLCKIPINPEDVIDNWLLNELISDPTSSLCERCESKDSFSYCQDCKLIICEPCFTKVHKGKYSVHKYTSLVRAPYAATICRTHNLDLDYFCTEEWKGICELCIDEHDGHPVLNITEAAKQTLIEVNNKRIRLAKIKDQAKYELDELEVNKAEVLRRFNDIVQITKDNFRQMHNLLDIKESETLDMMKAVKERKIDDVGEQEDYLKDRVRKLENVIKMIDILKEVPACNMMESMRFLTNLIQSSFDVQETLFSQVSTNFPYPEFRSLFQHLDSFSYNELESPSRTSSVRNSLTPLPLHRRQQTSNTLNVSSTSRYASPIPFRTSTPTMGAPEDVFEQRKFLSKQQTHNCIKLSWNHIAGTPNYVLEYGIGSKVNGVEQFRQVYQGSSYNCLITDLIPKTTYKFRVCAADENKTLGPWSETISVPTLEPQSMDESSFKNTASINKRNDEKWIQFERAGIIQASYPFYFGRHSWEVKVLSASFFNNEETAGILKIGVTTGRGKNVIGYNLVYASCKSVKINVMLDVEGQILKIRTSESNEVECFNTLSDTPQIACFQYKPARNCRNNVKILVRFDDKVNF